MFFGESPAVLCDPAYEAYQAYGLVEGKPSQILFDAPDEYLRRDPQAGAGSARRPVAEPAGVTAP